MENRKNHFRFFKSLYPQCFRAMRICVIMLVCVSAGCIRPAKVKIAENEFYVCSMDPQIMEKQPGPCPICKMPLAKTVIDKSGMNTITLSDEQKKLGNIIIDSVKLSVISNEHTLNGIFNFDQNKSSQVSTRISGRIERLYHKIIGERIEKGEKVYDLYSRELMLAQEEYLMTLEQTKNINSGQNISSASRNKLVLWGMNENQLDELVRSGKAEATTSFYSKEAGVIIEIAVQEGDIAEEGTKIYKLADLNTLWVEVQLYANELPYLEEGKKAEIIPASHPGEVLTGAVSFSNPELQGGTKINLVRIEINNKGMKFKPGEQAYVILKSDEKKAFVLPADAVIRAPKQSYIWIQMEKGMFETRRVTTGIQSKDKIEILTGLKKGDAVVVSGAYLLNSEFIFKRGAEPMPEMQGMN